MPEQCGRSFDAALLSGWLDGALTQADEQRVRIHLEDCGRCRIQVEQMQQLREVTMSTEFPVPPDDQWSERPRTAGSRLSIGTGWIVVIVWALSLGAYGAWELWTSDEALIEKLFVFGGWTGFGLLFIGVLLDRLKAMRTDRYREVQK
ncbi:MAG: zf-HC2 domain-containing protein [Acidobacteria bacterium]|nr:zf-HC2 domain-containing protein [Acidobacteriota bacterium]